jgi:quinol-cytochrome oxidoreductase complex cytochrome b subunit
VTPNPSKAPWYFLNLQELLLHMHPSLAGVIVPTVALLLIAVIPYVDR